MWLPDSSGIKWLQWQDSSCPQHYHEEIKMLTRRRFLKVFGLASLAFSFLPTILAKGSFSEPLSSEEAGSRAKNWLHGFPRRGCSTPGLTLERVGETERGLQDFVYRGSHERFLS